MKLSLGATTDNGRRANNEDSYAAVTGEELGIDVDAVLIVADGMGGRNFGEHASEAAVDSVKSVVVEKLQDGTPTHEAIKAAVETALDHANANVYEMSQRDDESAGMGTTCVVAVIAQGRLHLGHVGDSRAYVIHHGGIEQLTDDHSFVAEQVRAGLITEEAARKSKFRNVITRAVGIEPTVAPDVAEYPIEEVDALLLCSDGLSNMVGAPDLERTLLTARSPQAAADRLVRMAKVAGGADNITAVVARFGEGPIVELSVEDPPQADDKPAAAVDDEFYVYPKPSRAPTAILSILTLLFLASTIFLGAQLSQAGYTFQASPPFVVKPVPPAPPAPPDLTKLSYGAPQKFYPYPVRPDALALSPESKSLAVVQAVDQSVVRLSTVDGTTLYKFPMPMTTATVSTAPVAGRHWATDRQGNVYVSDAGAKSIYKLASTGELLETIAGLKKPEAIAVDDVGNIYVVDASTLDLIPATPTR